MNPQEETMPLLDHVYMKDFFFAYLLKIILNSSSVKTERN